MQIFRVKTFVFIVIVAGYTQTELSPDGENVCLKRETYEEKIEYKKYKPKLVKKKKWCWSITNKFSCEYYEQSFEVETDFRTVDRTRIVPKCCNGYKEETTERVTKCVPVCLKGCVNGKCIAPDICDCFAGFYGSGCEKECSEGLWGINCENSCDCFNNGTCNKITGACHCKEGWTGDRCEYSCQNGYYGVMCKIKCDCDNSLCHHITGECFTTTSITPALPEVSTVVESAATDTSLEAYQQTKTDRTFTKVTVNEISKTTEMDATEDNMTGPTGDTNFPAIIELSENKEETVSTTDFTNEMRATEKDIRMNNAGESETGLETSTNNVDDNEETKRTNNVTETLNSPTQINLGGNEGGIDKTEADNINNEEKGSSNKKTMLKIFHFLPGLSVLSSVSFLTFIIGSIWLISKHRNKTRKLFTIAEKKDKAEDQTRYPTENFFFSSDCTNNPAYLSDVDINRTIPVLETFKPFSRDQNENETRALCLKR